MKLLLIASAAIALTTTLGCSATTPSSVASSRNVYLGEREQVMEQTAIECGMGNGECTAHFHSNPKRRPEAKVEVNFFPIKGYKQGLTSSLNR